MIKKILKSFIPKIIFDSIKLLSTKNQVKNWEKNGSPNPPPHFIKQLIISEYQNKYNYSTLVETGTYMGDMVEAQKNNFN